MKIAQMKRLDSLLGLPACFGLSLLRAPFLWHRPRVPAKPRSILLIKFFGMGSLVQATPLLKALRARFPDAQIAFLTFESNRALLEHLPLVDRLITVRCGSALQMTRDVARMFFRLRALRPEVVLDLEYFSKFSNLVSYSTGAGMRIGYRLPKLWRGSLLTHAVHYNDLRHISHIFGALAVPLGIKLEEMDTSVMPLLPRAEEREQAVRLLEEAGAPKGSTLVGVNPNSSDLCLERRWAADRFSALIEKLCRRDDIRVYLVGAPGESAYVADLYKSLTPAARGHVLNLSGRTSLGALLGLLERTALFITNDSGPLHIAAAAGVPTLSFFGPETPVRFGPAGPMHRVLYAPPYCSPCLNVYNQKSAACRGDNICMRAIGVDEAWAAASEILEERKKGASHGSR